MYWHYTKSASHIGFGHSATFALSLNKAYRIIGSISAALSCRSSPKKDGWTREPQIMSVT